MEETTLSGARDNLPCCADQITRPFAGRPRFFWPCAVCAVVFVFVFLSRATTPPPTISTEQTARRASRIDPQEQAFLDSIARELIAEGKLTPDHPASPETSMQKPAAPMTPAERVKHYEDAVNTLLN